MKKMKNVYAAEEAGVWQTNVEVPSEISEQSDYQQMFHKFPTRHLN